MWGHRRGASVLFFCKKIGSESVGAPAFFDSVGNGIAEGLGKSEEFISKEGGAHDGRHNKEIQ